MKSKVLSAVHRRRPRVDNLITVIAQAQIQIDALLGIQEPTPSRYGQIEIEELQTLLQRHVPERIRELRVRRGLRQIDLAQKTGIARPNVARLEAQGRLPSLATLVRLSQALGVSLGELIEGQ